MQTKVRHKRTPEEKAALEQEALCRATEGESWTNYPAIFAGFEEKGIPEQDIRPRDNVLTYHAWRAKGRQVRRGEHGVKVVTWVPIRETDEPTGESKVVGKHSWTAVVFHISQTDPVDREPSPGFPATRACENSGQ